MEKQPSEALELPREYLDKPALVLCWRGLVISISEGFMTRKQAYSMLERFDIEDGKEPCEIVDLTQKQEPPDLVA